MTKNMMWTIAAAGLLCTTQAMAQASSAPASSAPTPDSAARQQGKLTASSNRNGKHVNPSERLDSSRQVKQEQVAPTPGAPMARRGDTMSKDSMAKMNMQDDQKKPQ